MPSLTLSNSVIQTPEQNTADHLAQITRDSFASLFTNWDAGVKIIWGSSHPQAVLDAVMAKFVADPANNDSPAEMFQRASQTAAFLESQLTGCTAATMALIKPFTANADGSIIVTIPPPLGIQSTP